MILRFCHPSGTHTIQTLLTRLKKRWEELNNWAKQRKSRLDEHRKNMEDERKLIHELSAWVKEKETVLEDKEKVPLPEENIDALKALLDEHKVSYILSSIKTWCSCCVGYPGHVFLKLNYYLVLKLFCHCANDCNSPLGIPRQSYNKTTRL